GEHAYTSNYGETQRAAERNTFGGSAHHDRPKITNTYCKDDCGQVHDTSLGYAEKINSDRGHDRATKQHAGLAQSPYNRFGEEPAHSHQSGHQRKYQHGVCTAVAHDDPYPLLRAKLTDSGQ